MNKLPIADVMMLHMNRAGTPVEETDHMRTYMFCMDMENLGRELAEEKLPQDQFISRFVEDIQKSSGYLSFSSFCEVDESGLVELAGEVFKLLV